MTPAAIFPTTKPPAIAPHERGHLLKHLRNWQVLNRHLASTRPDAEHLRKLIVLEAQTAERTHILQRLVGKLNMAERRRLYNQLDIT